MYIPGTNKITDPAEAVAFIRRFSFGTIITTQKNRPIATHLPFAVREDDSLILTSHFARANDHWKHLEGQESLVIFSEPHAYISPTHYEDPISVPTWNYLAVHAYGTVRLITEEVELFDLLRQTIDTYEQTYGATWEKLPDEYKQRMIRGIVGFELTVTELQGKKKLSQNKTETERANIIATLNASDHTIERQIAEYMQLERIRKE